MKKTDYMILLLLCTALVSCNKSIKKQTDMNEFERGTFGYDLSFLSAKDEKLVTLSGNEGRSQIIVSPGYQAKVFTSTAEGLSGDRKSVV
jgi:hypothetical protein